MFITLSHIVINALTELNKVKEEMVGMKFLTTLMEEKETGGELKENTVLYALRNDMTIEVILLK